MTNQEIINLIAEALEVDASILSLETKLQDLEEYDSMAKLSVIVLMDEEFNRKLSGDEMAKFETIGDIVAFAG